MERSIDDDRPISRTETDFHASFSFAEGKAAPRLSWRDHRSVQVQYPPLPSPPRVPIPTEGTSREIRRDGNFFVGERSFEVSKRGKNGN